MTLFDKFWQEVVSFSKKNWWIYIIYLLMMLIISRKQDIISVHLVTSVHFLADIFIMMMFSAYTRQEYKQGAYFQIVSLLLFISIKLYTGLSGGGWHYLLADPVYLLAAIKNYSLDVKKKDIKAINLYSTSALSILIILLVLIKNRSNSEFGLLYSLDEKTQTLGIFLFAIALSTTNNEKLRYNLSVTALAIMVIGSGWTVYNSLSKGVNGLDISYMLLPLTVLVFYLKKIKFTSKKNHGLQHAAAKTRIIVKKAVNH
ncbi:MAG: hypothetical protein QM768_01445 [Agriterribacter sp.]